MKKKVVCKPSEWSQDDLQVCKMTLGREYEVFFEHGYLYQVMDDNGFKVWMYKGNFDVLEQPKTPCPPDWKPAEGYEINDYEAECLDAPDKSLLTIGKSYKIKLCANDMFLIYDNTGVDSSYFKHRFATPTLRAGAKPKQITLNDEDVMAIADGIDNPNPPSETLKDAKVRYQEFKDNEPDPVNHPTHYGGENNPYEVIKVLEAWGLVSNAYLWNVGKYLGRAGKKDAILQELKKSHFYLSRAITDIEGGKEPIKLTKEMLIEMAIDLLDEATNME